MCCSLRVRIDFISIKHLEWTLEVDGGCDNVILLWQPIDDNNDKIYYDDVGANVCKKIENSLDTWTICHYIGATDHKVSNFVMKFLSFCFIVFSEEVLDGLPNIMSGRIILQNSLKKDLRECIIYQLLDNGVNPTPFFICWFWDSSHQDVCKQVSMQLFFKNSSTNHSSIYPNKK